MRLLVGGDSWCQPPPHGSYIHVQHNSNIRIFSPEPLLNLEKSDPHIHTHTPILPPVTFPAAPPKHSWSPPPPPRRLLSTDPEAAKDVVLAEKPVITDEASGLDSSLLDQLLPNIATLASIYHKPPEAFVSRNRPSPPSSAAEEEYNREGGEPTGANESSAPVPADITGGGAMASYSATPDMLGGLPGGNSGLEVAPKPASEPGANDLLGDLMGLGRSPEAPPSAGYISPAAHYPQSDCPKNIADLDLDLDFDLDLEVDREIPGCCWPCLCSPPLPVLQAASTGLQISGQVVRQNGSVFYHLSLLNASETALDGFMIQLNKNTFGVAAPAGALPVRMPE